MQGVQAYRGYYEKKQFVVYRQRRAKPALQEGVTTGHGATQVVEGTV